MIGWNYSEPGVTPKSALLRSNKEGASEQGMESSAKAHVSDSWLKMVSFPHKKVKWAVSINCAKRQTTNSAGYMLKRVILRCCTYLGFTVDDRLANVEDFAVVVNISVVAVRAVIALEGGFQVNNETVDCIG